MVNPRQPPGLIRVHMGRYEMGKIFRLVTRAVIKDEQGRYLMLKRTIRSDIFPGYWEFAGGKIDRCETFDQALIREVLEETGYTVSLTRVLGVSEWDRKKYTNVYIIMEVGVESGELKISPEHDDYAWMTTEELADIQVTPPLTDFVKKIVKENSLY